MNSNRQLKIETRINERKLELVNHQLREMSISDKLTEQTGDALMLLPSRVEPCKAGTGWKLALIFGDIDWFKSYNDAYASGR